jgi:hypothetical protein
MAIRSQGVQCAHAPLVDRRRQFSRLNVLVTVDVIIE